MPRWLRCYRKRSRRSESSCDSQTTSACLRRRKRRSHSPCWLMRLGTGGHRMCPLLQAQGEPRSWERFLMCEDRTSNPGLRTSDLRQRGPSSEVRRRVATGVFALLSLLLFLSLISCSAKPDPNTLVMIIESSPTNLDPRVGLDAFSERIDNLIFDDLLSRGDDL